MLTASAIGSVFFSNSATENTEKNAWKIFRIFFTLMESQRNKVNFNYERAGSTV